MKAECLEKYDNLNKILKRMGSAAIAFSGGVDSTLLLYAAVNSLGGDVIAVTAVSDIRHKDEKDRAQAAAKKIGVKHFIVNSEELSIREVKNNSISRCYYCKKNIFSKVMETAREAGISTVAEASTCDDAGVFRPGLRAIEELGIRRPLVEAGFFKREVREMLRNLDFESFDLPSESCLLTRFTYNESIDSEKLARVRSAEEFLRQAGFSQVRVRTYNDLARIEVPEGDIIKILSGDKKAVIVNRMKVLGYKYVTIDIEGFRSGSMDL